MQKKTKLPIKLPPLKLVVARFAEKNISKYELGKNVSTDSGSVYRWGYRGDRVPAKAQQRVLAFAEERGVRLTADEIISGGYL